jgi:hypothetical protein
MVMEVDLERKRVSLSMVGSLVKAPGHTTDGQPK